MEVLFIIFPPGRAERPRNGTFLCEPNAADVSTYRSLHDITETKATFHTQYSPPEVVTQKPGGKRHFIWYRPVYFRCQVQTAVAGRQSRIHAQYRRWGDNEMYGPPEHSNQTKPNKPTHGVPALPRE